MVEFADASLPLIEVPQRQDDGDFLRSVAEAVLQLLMDHTSTREDARRDHFAYIEGYHNRRRRHSVLGYRTPEQAERQMG